MGLEPEPPAFEMQPKVGTLELIERFTAGIALGAGSGGVSPNTPHIREVREVRDVA